MTLIQRIDSLLAVWRVMLPHVPEPAPVETRHWLNYEDSTVEAAIFRTAQKFSAEKLNAGFNPASAYRYVTATARTMAERKKMTQETQNNTQANRLAILTEVNKNFSHNDEAFHLADILSIIQSFEPTGNLQADVQTFLSKLELGHSFAEYSTAKDGFSAQAKKLVDTYGANATMEHVEQALANI